ncbi:MAG: SGNH/GDSL hydrolase family protein [Bacteroidia bacterium]
MMHLLHSPNRKRRLLLMGSMLMLLISGITLGTSMSPSRKSTEPVRLLALGDSYTIGESVAEDERWPMQLRDRLMENGVEVEWYKIIARTGWKCKELSAAIDASSVTNDYNLVGLLIGVNDYFQGRPIEEYKRRFPELLERAIKFAGGRKERVFVVSIPDYSYTPLYQAHHDPISSGIDQFNDANRKASLAAGVTYIDITALSRNWEKDPELVADDGLHPSGKQYAAWVKLMEPKILEMLMD